MGSCDSGGRKRQKSAFGARRRGDLQNNRAEGTWVPLKRSQNHSGASRRRSRASSGEIPLPGPKSDSGVIQADFDRAGRTEVGNRKLYRCSEPDLLAIKVKPQARSTRLMSTEALLTLAADFLGCRLCIKVRKLIGILVEIDCNFFFNFVLLRFLKSLRLEIIEMR
jgi:hypothetical protein